MFATRIELQITGSNNKPIAIDITFDETSAKQPTIIYAHGFNGFKDWGNFDLITQQFVDAGFTFVKFNFSHNGTSPQSPEDFVDLPAFGENNYTKELFDLDAVINWLSSNSNQFANYIDVESIGLIGHSMGGGIGIIKTAEDSKIKALCTWASISECKTPWGSWDAGRMKEWADTGVLYYTNGRTKQQMPLNYQLYLDYRNNQERLDIVNAATRIAVPFLICHGSNDTNVSIDSAYRLLQANKNTQLFVVASDHVFGRKHPWSDVDLPSAAQAVVNANITFFKSALQTA